jgi:hypothetical protein
MKRDVRIMIQPVPGPAGRRVAGAVAADLVCVLIFVLIGRHAHSEADSAAGVVATTWPFAVGVIGGYIGAALTQWSAYSWRGACVIVVKTLILGLVLRYTVARDGTPLPFIIVTTLFLTAFMMGWRLAVYGLRHQARRRSSTSSTFTLPSGRSIPRNLP